MAEGGSYRYRRRVPGDMSGDAFVLWRGKISGFLASFLGVMSLLAVLCFRYPSYLTTPELRENYDVEFLRGVLLACMCASVVFGTLTFVLGGYRKMGLVGLLAVVVAYALGGHAAQPSERAAPPLSAGLDWLLLSLLAFAAGFIFIEKTFPKYRQQVILRPEWQTDLIYYGANHLFIGAVLLISNVFAPTAFGWARSDAVVEFVRSLPLAAQVLLLALLADFVLYWVHRMLHEVPLFWNVHAVHHSIEHLDWLAGSRIHVLEVVVVRALAMVPLYLLGPSRDALDAYVVFAALQSVFVHANVGFDFGPLRYVVATPHFHHWHHSSEKPAIDTNYAVHFPLWDLVFGTFHLPRQHWPATYGTTERLPRTFWRQLTYPIARRTPPRAEP